jgi:hypothetical protein
MGGCGSAKVIIVGRSKEADIVMTNITGNTFVDRRKIAAEQPGSERVSGVDHKAKQL